MDEAEDAGEFGAWAQSQGDQMRAGLAEFAQALVEFRKALVDGGFAQPVADQMAYDYYSVTLAAGFRNA